MNWFTAIILGITAYCIVDRWCLHREHMKQCCEETNDQN